VRRSPLGVAVRFSVLNPVSVTQKNLKQSRSGFNSLPTKQQILEFIQSSPAKVGKREIARAFNIKGGDRIALKSALKELADDGLITGPRTSIRERGQLPPVAVIEIKGQDAEGDTYATPLSWDEAGEGPAPRILVLESRGRRAITPPGAGDHVLARIEAARDPDSGYAYAARPMKVLPRTKGRELGVFRKAARGEGGGGVIHPIDRKALREWRVDSHNAGEAGDGELVRYEIVRQGGHGLARARVVERLGNPEAQRAVSLIAIHAHGLRHAFPEAARREVDSLPEPELRGREDLRHIPLITIDPEDARDHDDAVWASADSDPANPGGFVVIVAIADVGHYVRPGGALDREALLRGNSVYFPDRVTPMLPEELSNNLCSLKEKEDRPCLAARMVFDANGRKISHRFMRAMMRSGAKLAYKEAQAAIDGRGGAKARSLLAPVLQPLWAAYAALSKARDARAPLALDIPERKIILDDSGKVVDILTPERLDAHRLIEEFMIAANVAAAETLESLRSPFVYRVHETPATEKLMALGDFLATLGLKLPKSGLMKPENFNRLLDRVKDSEHAELVNEVVLRAQAQAEYRAANGGHFGLNLRRYAHFTSPIRRYADLIAHRALIRSLKLGAGGLTDDEAAQLGQTAEAISAAERRAMAAERDTADRLIASYLASSVGAKFDGRISGVAKSGLFVKLNKTGAQGFVPASTIGDDFYAYAEAEQALVGRSTGEVYRLGDAVEVKLAEALPMAGALRFELLSEGRIDSKLAGGRRRAPTRRVRTLRRRR
jgi:ribonuclease R